MSKSWASFREKFGPEHKAWVRTIEALLILLLPYSLAAAVFLSPATIELSLLRSAFYGALICSPILAWTMYRETSLSQLERLAILVLALSLCLALMVAIIESGVPT